MKSYEIVPKQVFAALVARGEKLENLVRGLRRAQELEHDLLMVALHELAAEREIGDRQAYARHWIGAKRRAWANETSLPRAQEGGDARNGS